MAALAPTAPAEVMALMDRVEARILEIGGAVQGRGKILPDFPVVHHFTPGLYCREIHMPAGGVLTSKIHKTEHPFVVSKGHCIVYLNRDEWEDIRAPHFGVTKPGTRRLLFILEDTVWTTFHPTDLTDLLEIEDALIEPHENPLLAEGLAQEEST